MGAEAKEEAVERIDDHSAGDFDEALDRRPNRITRGDGSAELNEHSKKGAVDQ